MMPFPQFTVAQLSQFSGRDLEEYTGYADAALMQATVVFMIVTELRDFPTDPFDAQVAQLGILAYADALFLEQPYQEVTHNPFQSQTIGSTSWSKPVAYARGNAATNALKGEQTGIAMFDLAVQKLSLRSEFGGVYGRSIEMRFDDGILMKVDEQTGEIQFIGPSEMNQESMTFGIDWNTDVAIDENSSGGYSMRG